MRKMQSSLLSKTGNHSLQPAWLRGSQHGKPAVASVRPLLPTSLPTQHSPPQFYSLTVEKHVNEYSSPLVVAMGRRSDKIAARKGKENAKKAKVYGRIGKKLVQVVKQGGPDPIANSNLADVLKMAKDLNVPKDIIERNIKRASDSKQADFTEICYEAYGPGGTGFIVECLTDNVNRSASEVKAAINKAGCKVAEPGSVMFNFSRAGQVYVMNSSEDAVFEAAMEVGGDDVAPAPATEEGVPSNNFKVFTSVEDYITAKGKMVQLGFNVNEEECGLIYKANAPVEVDDAAFEVCESLMERLLELDDVDSVYTNCDGLEA